MRLSDKDIVDALTKVYLEKEVRQEKLSEKEAKIYFAFNLANNRIIMRDDDPWRGYLLYWKLHMGQLYHLERGEFHLYSHNITDGHVCHIQSIWTPEKGRKKAYADLLSKLWKREGHLTKYVSWEREKRGRPIKVHDIQTAFKKWINPILED